MSTRGQLFLPLLAAAMLQACASKWQDEQATMKTAAPTASKTQGQPSGCPKLYLGTIVIEPCCAADGMCGGDGTKVGYGCSSIADPMFRSVLSNPPEPRACGAGDAPAAAGGMSGAPPATANANSIGGSAGARAPVSSAMPPSSANASSIGGTAGSATTATGSSAGGSATAATNSSTAGSGASQPAAGTGNESSSDTGGDAEKCPSVMAFGATIQPCCTADNHCGADGSSMGFGCVDLSDPMFRMAAGNGIPAPQTCDGMPL